MGAWIETTVIIIYIVNVTVAPYVGAWIETSYWHKRWVRHYVAPYVGAWIETSPPRQSRQHTSRRTLRGCVD